MSRSEILHYRNGRRQARSCMDETFRTSRPCVHRPRAQRGSLLTARNASPCPPRPRYIETAVAVTKWMSGGTRHVSRSKGRHCSCQSECNAPRHAVLRDSRSAHGTCSRHWRPPASVLGPWSRSLAGSPTASGPVGLTRSSTTSVVFAFASIGGHDIHEALLKLGCALVCWNSFRRTAQPIELASKLDWNRFDIEFARATRYCDLNPGRRP